MCAFFTISFFAWLGCIFTFNAIPHSFDNDDVMRVPHWWNATKAQRINEQNRFIGIAVKKTNGEKEDNVWPHPRMKQTWDEHKSSIAVPVGNGCSKNALFHLLYITCFAHCPTKNACAAHNRAHNEHSLSAELCMECMDARVSAIIFYYTVNLYR